MKTLKEMLIEQNNDYGEIESELSSLNINFHELIYEDIKDFMKTSVIIPAYNLPDRLQFTIESLSRQRFNHDLLEIIIVDDHSEMNLFEEMTTPDKMNVRFFRNRENFGSGISRNIGLYHSTGDIAIFLDSDMIPGKSFLREHSIRHRLCDPLILLGFKENIEFEELSKIILNEPDPKKDPRYNKNTSKYGIKDRNISLYLDTRGFKDFGNGGIMYEDYLPNGWTLPEAIVAHSLSVKRKYAIEVGGFDPDFRIWGYEDSHFGAKCVARGLFAIPLLSCASYHLRHPKRREENKERSRGGNRDTYLSKLESIFRLFDETEFENQISYFLNNSVEIKG